MKDKNRKWNAKKMTHSEKLNAKLISLEQKKKEAEESMKYELHQLREILTPRNLIRNAVQNILSDPSKRKKLLMAGAGVGAAFVLNRFIGKKTLSIAKLVVPALVSLMKKRDKSNGIPGKARR